MQLITKKTTLEEFTNSNKWFVKDPKTKRICKLTRTDVGVAFYMHSYDTHQGAFGQYLCFFRREGGVAVTSLVNLLELIQGDRFRII